MTASRKARLILLFLILGCSIGCDQTSKYVARAQLSNRSSVTLPGGFGELCLAENPGSFLSLGSSLPQSARLAVFTVGVGIGLFLLLAWLVEHARKNWPSFIGLALVMAGGVSNLIDRITGQGLVTDFIFLQVGSLHTGVFNLADMMIMAGIAVLVVTLGKRKKRAPALAH